MKHILPLLQEPDPRLRYKSSEVQNIDEHLRKYMGHMLNTMYHHQGIGLAAPQVNMHKRIIVIDLQDTDDENQKHGFYPLFLINPTITEYSKKKISAAEGCLSVPEQSINVIRPKAIKCTYTDRFNKKQTIYSDKWLARVIQHEMDHLDGKLIVDYLKQQN